MCRALSMVIDSLRGLCTASQPEDRSLKLSAKRERQQTFHTPLQHEFFDVAVGPLLRKHTTSALLEIYSTRGTARLWRNEQSIFSE